MLLARSTILLAEAEPHWSLHGHQDALSTWLLALHLLSQTRIGVSSLKLGCMLGVNDTSSWLVKHNLARTIRERDQRNRSQGTVHVYSIEIS